MEQKSYAFIQGTDVLPEALREQLLRLEEEMQCQAEEIRLRLGQPVTVVLPDGERTVGEEPVQRAHLERLLEIASCASVHTVMDQLREGFVTIPGGHRIGFCGTAVMEQGNVRMLRDLSSASIRLARQFPGIARGVLKSLTEHDQLKNTLVLAPPGGGKTSLLRDLIRCISNGECGRPLRIGVVDQRGELSAMCRGEAQMDLGGHTDVICACPKDQGLLLLLRGMNPQVLAVDEITAPEDIRALTTAAGCGVVLLATAHAGSVEHLRYRPIYRALLHEKVFSRAVVIQGSGAHRSYHTEVLG